MPLSKINNEKKLLEYLHKHNTVKDSLIPSVLDIGKKIYPDQNNFVQFMYKHHFFRKPDIVISVLDSKSDEDLIKLLTDLAINNRDIVLLNRLDKRFPKRERSLIQKLFSEELSLNTLFECIIVPNNTSIIRSEAIERVKARTLSPKELLIFINSLNLTLSISSSQLLVQLRDNFEDDYKLSNCAFEINRPTDKSLLDLRKHLLVWAASTIKERWEMMLLIDLVYRDDINYLKGNVEPKYIAWMNFELEFSSLIPATYSFEIITWLEAEEKDLWSDFNIIWDGFVNSDHSDTFEHYFNLIKLKLIYPSDLGLESDIDFKKVLNHPFTAYYIKSLHDLKIIDGVPMMKDLIHWPDIDDVKLYLKKFDNASTWNEESPLKRLGYHVGLNSDLTEEMRRDILSRAFLSATQQQLKATGWGLKGSPKRLRKIISFLDHRIKIARGVTDRNLDTAIQDWSKDLEFIYSKFYDGKYADEFIQKSFE